MRKMTKAQVKAMKKSPHTVYVDVTRICAIVKLTVEEPEKGLICPPHITEPQVARPLIRLLKK